jgi:cytochrome c biogenesis protein CcmG/thiol:disulfide interchange protein DsbE
VSGRHVPDDAHDDERQKVDSMFSRVWIKLGLVIAIVGGIAGLLAYGFIRDARYIHSPLIAAQAPAFVLTLFDGNSLHSKDFVNKAVLLNFWASWCVPCRAEAVALENAWRKYKDRGVVFIGVNIQDKEENARAFMKEFGITYLNGPDASGKIAIDYGVWGIPETFFLDPQGRITYKHAGEVKAPLIEAKLDEALKGIVSAEGKSGYQSVR